MATKTQIVSVDRDNSITQGHTRRPTFRLSDAWRAPLHDLPIRDEILYQYLPLSPEMEILEIGPGSGFTAFRLARLIRHLTLLDVAPGTIQTLKDSLEGLHNLDFICASLNAPDLCQTIGKTFDAAYAIEVFTYVPNPAQSLRNLAGLLRPGGKLLLNWPNYSTARTKGVNYIPTVPDLDRMMRDAGFASWSVSAVRLRRHANLIFENLYRPPMNFFRRVRGDADPRSAPNFDQTWHHRKGGRLEPYRPAVHLGWMLLFAGFRLGGKCFERIPLREGSADGNLLLLAQR